MRTKLDPTKITHLRNDAAEAGRETSFSKIAVGLGYKVDDAKTLERSLRTGASLKPKTFVRAKSIIGAMLGREVLAREFVDDKHLTAELKAETTPRTTPR